VPYTTDFRSIYAAVLDRWLGFSSTAEHKTAFYLDNIELTNTAAE
jgi:uncharacterized protein (DUF1501 family)